MNMINRSYRELIDTLNLTLKLEEKRGENRTAHRQFIHYQNAQLQFLTPIFEAQFLDIKGDDNDCAVQMRMATGSA